MEPSRGSPGPSNGHLTNINSSALPDANMIRNMLPSIVHVVAYILTIALRFDAQLRHEN